MKDGSPPPLILVRTHPTAAPFLEQRQRLQVQVQRRPPPPSRLSLPRDSPPDPRPEADQALSVLDARLCIVGVPARGQR